MGGAPQELAQCSNRSLATEINTTPTATDPAVNGFDLSNLQPPSKSLQPPQSIARRRYYRSRAPGCLPVISASVEICRHQNVIGGAKEAVGEWHGCGLPRAQ